MVESRPVEPELVKWFANRIAQRTALGIEKYGEPLRTHNERSAKRDKTEELLDALQYQHQELMETEDERDSWRAYADMLADQVIQLGGIPNRRPEQEEHEHGECDTGN